jgi:hypothetical protein
MQRWKIPARGLRPELLPTPEPDEVVPPLLEEVEVSVVIELLGSVGTLGAGPHPIVEVVPDV